MRLKKNNSGRQKPSLALADVDGHSTECRPPKQAPIDFVVVLKKAECTIYGKIMPANRGYFVPFTNRIDKYMVFAGG